MVLKPSRTCTDIQAGRVIKATVSVSETVHLTRPAKQLSRQSGNLGRAGRWILTFLSALRLVRSLKRSLIAVEEEVRRKEEGADPS
jgi:hypothetical protein